MMGVLTDAPRGSAAGGPARSEAAVAVKPRVERMRAGDRCRLVATQAVGPSDDAAE
jgi:hypothetical protein